MVTGIIGRKVGMTQIFDADGTVHPATVIKAGPCVVVQAKNAQTDGYEAVQLGLVEETPAKVSKPMAGHYKKANVPPTRVRREVKVAAGRRRAEGRRPGARVDLRQRRARGRRSAPAAARAFRASSSAITSPAARRRTGRCSTARPARSARRRFRRASSRGCARPGRMGGGRVTIHNLKVLRVDPDNHLLIVEGGIPGAPTGYVIVRKAVTRQEDQGRAGREAQEGEEVDDDSRRHAA